MTLSTKKVIPISCPCYHLDMWNNVTLLSQVLASPTTSVTSRTTSSASPPDTTTLSPVAGGRATPQHSPTADTTTSSVDDVISTSPSTSPASTTHQQQVSFCPSTFYKSLCEICLIFVFFLHFLSFSSQHPHLLLWSTVCPAVLQNQNQMTQIGMLQRSRNHTVHPPLPPLGQIATCVIQSQLAVISLLSLPAIYWLYKTNKRSITMLCTPMGMLALIEVLWKGSTQLERTAMAWTAIPRPKWTNSCGRQIILEVVSNFPLF